MTSPARASGHGARTVPAARAPNTRARPGGRAQGRDERVVAVIPSAAGRSEDPGVLHELEGALQVRQVRQVDVGALDLVERRQRLLGGDACRERVLVGLLREEVLAFLVQ